MTRQDRFWYGLMFIAVAGMLILVLFRNPG